MLSGILLGVLASTFHQASSISNSDVTFYLSTNTNVQPRVLTSSSSLNTAKVAKVLLHGWTESYQSKWIQNLTQAYIQKGDYNIIAVDYSGPASLPYFTAVSVVPQVGQIIGTRLNNLGIPTNKIHIIGHSMGGQVASYVGQTLQELTTTKVQRITGLDPAGPGYQLASASQRLSSDDAVFVDVIHTDAGVFGISFSCGTVDFYPNGGHAFQPGCGITSFDILSILSDPTNAGQDFVFCSHRRSTFLFIESVNSKRFVSSSCPSWYSFCFPNNKVIMGEDVPVTATGNFYLSTNAESPFAQG